MNGQSLGIVSGDERVSLSDQGGPTVYRLDLYLSNKPSCLWSLVFLYQTIESCSH